MFSYVFMTFGCLSGLLDADVELKEHISGFGSFRFLSHALRDLGAPPRPLPFVTSLPPTPRVSSEEWTVETRGQGFGLRERGTAGDWAKGIKAWWPAGEATAQHRLEEFLKLLKRGDFEGRKRLLSDERLGAIERHA